MTRRQFLYYSTLAAGATALTGCATPRPRRLSANEKLNIGVIGAGGKGASDTECCAGENIVALCDVDEKATASRRNKYPKAKFYRDWRKMLDVEKSLDAVVVSTPDHTHAIAAATAMRLGKHVYCQKPLTQTIYEARLLRKLARQCKVCHADGKSRQRRRRPAPRGRDHPGGSDRPGAGGLCVDQPPDLAARHGSACGLGPGPRDAGLGRLDWAGADAALQGRVARASRPAAAGAARGAVYQPFVWRGWQDFGTGALGDMACHTANMPFRALKLGYPTEIEATSSAMNKESYPLKSTIRFEFPARDGLPPVTFWWYDGGNPKPDHPYDHDGSNKPPKEVLADVRDMMDKIPGSGCLLIGDNGKLFSPDDYGAQFFIKLKGEKELTDGKNHEAVKAIPQTIPRNAFQGGADQRHHLEWIAACKGGPPGYSDFDIAAYLTEIILLGCVALRVGRKIEWDGPNMLAKNAPEAAQFIRRKYRKGWESLTAVVS